MRIGIFLCGCGGLIDGILDMDLLARAAIDLEDVVRVERHPFLCSPEGRERMRETIVENRIDRLVVGACSPLLYLEEFMEVAEGAGMNRYMVDMANLREQCAWVHSHLPAEADRKAREVLEISVARVSGMSPTEHGAVAIVNPDYCDGCGVCRTVCSGNAIRIVDTNGRRSVVDPSLCEGCGVCVSSCPSGAMDMELFSNGEMLAQIDAATDQGADPNIIVFACHWCAYAAADLAGAKRMSMNPHFKVIRTICSARVDVEWIMRAISRGVDGVLVMGAEPGHCRYMVGSLRTRNRMILLNNLLDQLGFDRARVRFAWADADDADKFHRVVSGFIDDIMELGPSPVGCSLGAGEDRFRAMVE